MPTEQLSKIYIDGKRMGQMQEIAEAKFGEHFLSIEVRMPDRIFIIRLQKGADIEEMKKFTEKYRLCKVEVFPRIEFTVYKGKKELVQSM